MPGKKSNCDLVLINDDRWYHDTSESAAGKIIEGGFKLPDDPEAYFMYGKGIYFLDGNMPRGRYFGPARLRAHVKGYFIYLWMDAHPVDCNWFSFYEDDFKKNGRNWDAFMEAKQKEYPGADGYILATTGCRAGYLEPFENMLVVWNPLVIKDVTRVKKVA